MDTRARREAGRITYQPALDGLRAVAVVAVLLYHHTRGPGFGWIGRGGFLGVDVFFVLSGYLITSLLLAEHASSGAIAFRRFWGRRARRLLPAFLTMLVLAVVLARVVYSPSQQLAIHDDLPYALLYVENWHIALGHGLALPNAIGHTWSLSIEEQFYVIWPVLLGGLLVLTRRSPRQLLLVVGTLAIASAVWTSVWLSPHRAYFGTDARAQELLVGAALAVLASTVGLQIPERFRRVLNVGGALLLAGLLVLLVGAPESDRLWRHGGMLTFAVATVLLIAAAVQSHGVARVILASPVLVAIGQISYGLYLFHIPVFLWIDASTGIPRVPLFFVRIGITAAIAIASYRFIEQPIRRGRFAPRILIPVAVVIAAGILVLAPAASSPSIAQPKSEVLSFLLSTAAHRTPPGATNVLVVGGNRASLLNLASKGPVHIGSIWAVSVGTIGCGLTSPSVPCRAVPDDLHAIARAFRAKAVVLMLDERDLDGASTSSGSESLGRAATARLETMRRAVGPRPVGILTVPCSTNPPTARDAFDASVTAWAGRHHVVVSQSAAVRCDGDAVTAQPTAVVWHSVAKLVTGMVPPALRP